MTLNKVEIVHLDAIRVASAYGFGLNPEEIAWGKLVEWAKPRGFLDDLAVHPIFGLNNPYPSGTSPRYGYEFWIKVDPDVEPEGDIRIGEFLGGNYAVAQCEVQGHPENIARGWQELVGWCKENNHSIASHHALERFLTNPGDVNNLVLDLCCPIIS